MSDERETPHLSEDLAAGEPEGAGPGVVPASFEVFLAPTRTAHLRGPLGWLARLYGLDVYGGSQLGRQASLALQASALLLVVIVSFDLMAWTLLFNSIFHASGDIRDIDPFWTPLAALLGLLFAAAVFLYERQFLTADTSEVFTSFWKFLSVTLAVSLRLGILIVAALITAQPIELLIFREPIRKRVHEEAVREEIVGRSRQIKIWEANLELLKNPDTASEQTKQHPEQEQVRLASEKLSAAESELKEDQNHLNSKAQALSSAEGALEQTKLEIEHLQASLPGSPKANSTLANQIKSQLKSQEKYTGQVARLKEEVKNLSSRVESQKDTVNRLKQDQSTAVRNLSSLVRDIRENIYSELKITQDHVRSLQSYIDRVKKDGMGPIPITTEIKGVEKATPEEGKQFSYSFRGTHFFDQLRVLQDLREGRQPRWPAGTPEDPTSLPVDQKSWSSRTQLAAEFALDDLSTDQQKKVLEAVRLCPFLPSESDRPTESDLEVERRVAEACLLRRSYGVAYAIAMVIPLLVLAVKFLIPRELKHYFSLRQQAWAGNPEALSSLRGEQRMREERRQARDWRGTSKRWGLPSERTAPDA
jgi:hypothetical protein